jgi:tetratricopeptide (TPR) repeat protein
VTRVIYNLGLRYCSSPVVWAVSVAAASILCPALRGADSAEAAFQRAASALSSGNYTVAESGFQAVLKLEPRNIAALGNLGVVYSRTHRYQQAIETYQRALQIAPADRGLTTNLGLAYLKQERYGAALPVFETLARDPANLQARELLESCRLSLGQYQKALDGLQALAAASPRSPGVLFMLGVTLARLKRSAEAHEAFTRMMSVASPAQANFLMGKASYETEQFAEAAEFFRKALRADPALDGAHRELGKVLISLHEDEAAETELRLAGAADAEAVYFLGGLVSQTRPGEAIPLLETARKLNPDFWGPFYYLGRINVEQGRPKEAIPLLERAAKLNPEEAAIQYQLGRALQKSGRTAEANAAFARVKELKSRLLRKEVDLLTPGAKP